MTEKKSYLLYITAMFFFGSIGLFVRYIPLSSGMLAFFRGFLGCLFILVLLLIKKDKIPWQNLKKNALLLILSGSAIGFNWLFLFEAYRYTTIANATLSYYFAPVFVIIASPFILKEPFTVKKVLCTVGAVIGMFFIVGTDSGGSNNFLGVSFGLAAAVLYAFVVIVNKFIKGLSGLNTTFAQLFFASLAIAPYAIYTNTTSFGDLTLPVILLILWVGIFNTGICYSMYFTGMQGLKAQTIALNSYIDPVTAIVLATIFLGETMAPIQICGGILILGSTFFSELQKKKKQL